MPIYQAPLRDMTFVLKEFLEAQPKLQKFPGFEEFTDDLIDAVLNEGAKFAENVLFPLNLSGDQEGCHYQDGEVKTPKGFKEAYWQFIEGGWSTLTCDPKYGGQGMPELLGFFLEEMTCSANLSFGLYPGLTRGAYTLLNSHGSEDLKEKYLHKLVSGIWTGTMCLTEPHCGTDLGLLRTKATPQEDGSYTLEGTKIFISSGEHDLSENIIHFVLARTPEASIGTKGISLFLVPKFLPNKDGNPGERNPVYCASIEHKMGIKASSTCVMNFDGAQGWLVGDLYNGMSHMFTMMNTERLGVGNQGLGISEIAYQNALAYARERLQGRALRGAKFPDKPADPIIVHSDIRKMLLTMKALNEGNRMMAAWVAMSLDISKHSPDEKERQNADDLVQLMTPVVKAFLTDSGTDIANLAVQVYGGHGYIKEHGVEQFARDARITQIYEGTNGIQAMDLIGRKLPAHTGRFLRQFFHPVQAYLEDRQSDQSLAEFILPLAKAFGRLQQATVTVAQRGLSNPDEAGAAATDYLQLFGLTCVAYLWCRAVEVAKTELEGTEDTFYTAKIETARFFMQKVLPRTSALFACIMAGSASLMGYKEESFGPF